ncbi:MAG: AgmX/PglI C-terminal domain-containing protein [Polyangiaceae bacterium]
MATHSFSLAPTFAPSGKGRTSYALVPQAPAPHASEVEDAQLEALEVTISWGDNVLHSVHLSPPRAFTVGEGGDFLLPTEVLGQSRVELVSGMGSAMQVSVPPGAKLVVSHDDGRTESMQGAWNLAPRAEAVLTLHGDIIVRMRAVAAGKKVDRGVLASLANAVYKHVGFSLVMHAGVIGSLAFFMPKMGVDDAEEQNRDQILMMQKYLNASAAHETEQDKTAGASDGSPSGGQEGERAKGAEGKIGSTTAKSGEGRWAKQGPPDNPNPALSRKELLQQAAQFGMVGLVSSSNLSDMNAPTSPWAPDVAQGKDSTSANGNMWAANIGDAPGLGGLGLLGADEGGGGNGVGIGIGKEGVMGPGLGHCTPGGNCVGVGNGPGGWGRGGNGLKGNHVPKGPSARPLGETIGGGHIPPEVIQRIVRANFGRFRNCYESALRTNPSLSGRVATKFVIDRTGAVSAVSDGGSDIPDRGVVSCVNRSFYGLSFPQPEGGVVTVTYPILFAPGE